MLAGIIATLAALALAGAFAQEPTGSDAVLDISHNGAHATVRLSLHPTASATDPEPSAVPVPEPGPGLTKGSVFGITGVDAEASSAGEGGAPVYHYTFGWIAPRAGASGATFRVGSFALPATFAFSSLTCGLAWLTIYPQARDSFVALGGGGGGYRTDAAVVPEHLRPEFAFWSASAYTNGYSDGEGGLMDYGAKPIGIRVGSDGYITIFPLAEVSFTGFGKFDTIQLIWKPRS